MVSRRRRRQLGYGRAITSCGTGVLLEGDPLWTDFLTATSPRQGLFDDPPIRSEAIAVIGSMLFVETEFEIWSADMSQKTPRFRASRGGDLGQRFCRRRQGLQRYALSRDARHDREANGKLAVVDYVGGAIIEITIRLAQLQERLGRGTHVKRGSGQRYRRARRHGRPGAGALFGDVGGGGGSTTSRRTRTATCTRSTTDRQVQDDRQRVDPDRTVSTIGKAAPTTT